MQEKKNKTKKTEELVLNRNMPSEFFSFGTGGCGAVGEPVNQLLHGQMASAGLGHALQNRLGSRKDL